MNYEDLINLLVESFKTGVPKNITADKLREALIKVVEFANITRGDYQGTANPTDNPGTPSTPVYYFAGQSGTYTNFGGITVDSSEGINILSYSGSAWSKAVVPIDLSGYLKEGDLGGVVLDVAESLLGGVINEGSIWRTDNGIIANLSAGGYPQSRRSEELIAVTPGDIYLYTGTPANTAGVSGYNSSKTHISRILDTSGLSLYPSTTPQVNKEITIPSNVFFVGVSSRSTSLGFGKKESRGLAYLITDILARLNFDSEDFAKKEDLEHVENTVDALGVKIDSVFVPGKNLINQEDLFYGLYSAAGVLGSSANTVVTPLIEISPERGPMSLNKNLGIGVTHRFVFFDVDKVHISNLNRGTEKGFTAPSNAKYVGINITSITGGIGDPTDPGNSYTGDLQLEYGEESTSFQRYGEIINPSSLPDYLGYKPKIRVSVQSADSFTVLSRHDNGEEVNHTWVKLNKAAQYDVGWYAPSIIHRDRTVVQGSFNWIHMTALTNEDQHVGHGHGCETDVRAQFYVDGKIFIPADEVGNTIEGELFSFNIATEIYAADSANSPNGSNVVPQLPLVISTKHHMVGEIAGNSLLKFKNKLVIMRDGTTFARCYIAMQDATLEYFDRLQINNIENSMNALNQASPTFTAIPPSTAVFNGVSYNTADGFRAELATSAIAYSDRYGYIFKTDVVDVNQDWDKMHVQTASTGKIYFHPIITTQIAARAGVPVDVFNRGDVIEGTIIRQLIL